MTAFNHSAHNLTNTVFEASLQAFDYKMNKQNLCHVHLFLVDTRCKYLDILTCQVEVRAVEKTE